MCDTRTWKMRLFVALIFSFALFIGISVRNDQQSCLGVRILPEEKLSSQGEYAYRDFCGLLLYNDMPAAMDIHTSTIYLSQRIEEKSRFSDLEGKLRIDESGYTLYFLDDEQFDDLDGAVKEGHPFKLAIVNRDQTYMQYDVIFTTLPVINVDGWQVDWDERQRRVYEGSATVWTAHDPKYGSALTVRDRVVYHIRGRSSVNLDKKPWKLELKKDSREPKNTELLGMGTDDDWLLNPMNQDDLGMRERLITGLWNEWALQAPWNMKMSSGEYVELVLRGSYQGVYMLQRRLDKRILNLNEEDVLLRRVLPDEAMGMYEIYEVVDAPMDDESARQLLRDALSGTGTAVFDLDNFVDVCLFMDFAAAWDNIMQNVFYAFVRDGDGYRIVMIPWDTDLSLGLVWIDGSAYDFDKAVNMRAVREEYDEIAALYPQLNERMRIRWRQLRESVLSLDHIYERIDLLEEELMRSDTKTRDYQLWGLRNGGQDTLQALRELIAQRFVYLDEVYRLDEN